jgi:hypothetical protein
MATQQQQQQQQSLLNTVQAVFGDYLDENVVRTVFEADQAKDFVLVSDVLWELLPEVSAAAAGGIKVPCCMMYAISLDQPA